MNNINQKFSLKNQFSGQNRQSNAQCGREAMVTMIRNFCNGSSGINWRRLDKAQNSFFFFKNRNIFAKNWSISKRLIFRAIKDYQIPNVAPKPMVTFAKES